MSGLPSASQAYTDTFIVDCNRNSSIEADNGNNDNPATFTNKQGTGLKLNAGDKVSIHSAFINEIGNTDGTIEFKGTSIKNTHQEEITYELEETEDTLSHPFPLDDLYSLRTDEPWTEGGTYPSMKQKFNMGQILGNDKKQILQPYGYQQCDCSNVKKSFTLKDNEMNVQVSYYKTANGENYMHLPRRFDCMDGVKWGVEKTPGGTASKAVSTRATDENSLNWAYLGMQWSEAPFTARAGGSAPSPGVVPGYFDGGWNGQPTQDVRIQSQVPADWFHQDKGIIPTSSGGWITAANDHTGIGLEIPNQGVGAKKQGALNVLGTGIRYRWKNDNSRYTIFKKERTFFTTAPQKDEFLHDGDKYRGQVIKPANTEAGSTTNDFLAYTSVAADGHTAHGGAGNKDNNFYFNTRDPACTGDWVPYYEIKNIKVEPGFKSPNDIADEVSRGLNQTGKVKKIYARTGKRQTGAHPEPTEGQIGSSHQVVGLQKDGELFKGFYSTNHGHFNSGNAKEYFTKDAGDGATFPEKLSSNIRYMSAYHYIGVKRPELWITGRKFVKESCDVKPELGKTWGELQEFSIHPDRPPITRAQGNTADICTNIPWSQRHLLKDFVVAQGIYPELFNYPWSRMKDANSAYATNDDVLAEDFQMGNSKTGERLAGFIHYDLIKKEENCYKEGGLVGGKLKGGSRRLGNDGYDFQVNTDYNPRATGAETASGYTLGAGPPKTYNIPATDALGQTDLKGHLPYYDLSSAPLWFWYDQSRAELDEGGNDLDEDDFNLCYGFMKKYNPASEGDSVDELDYIAFSTTRIGGVSDHIFQTGGNPQLDTFDNVIDSNHYIGVDRHFNAYGTKCMMLYSGKLAGDQPLIEGIGATKVGAENSDFEYVAPPGNDDNISGIKPITGDQEQTYQYNLHQYVGANNPLLSYGGGDTDTDKRFSIRGLHTPEYIGNNFNSGRDGGDPTSADEANAVYKINKRLSGATYCPEMQPYQTDIATTTKDEASQANNGVLTISTTNWNLEQWTAIYDASSGVMFSSFGGTEDIRKYWHKTLWGLLGYSYDQFNPVYVNDKDTDYKNRLNQNSRLNPENINKVNSAIFTNALVKTSDISLYSVNMYGADLFTQEGISAGSPWNVGGVDGGKSVPATDSIAVNNPAISVDATSIGIKANRQPTKMLRPYYLIKSNIVGDMKYIGAGHSTDGGQQLPIIGVVNKENGFGDYYFQTDQKAVFTITQDRTLSEIVTSIHDPDMSSARVDKNSAVLYMVEKTNNNNLNLISGLLQSKVLPPTAVEPPVMTDAEYNAYFAGLIQNKKQQEIMNEGYVQAHYDQGGELVNPVPDEQRARSLESFLGFRQGETPDRVIGESRVGPGADEVHNTPQGTLTRTQARNLEAFRGIQERAKAGLYSRMVPAGRSHPEQSSEMPGWYRQTIANAEQEVRDDSTIASGSAPGMTAPSDPQTPRQREPEPQPDAPRPRM